MTLRDLSIGQKAIITDVEGQGALRQHLLDMGVIPQAEVSIVKFAPMGDPVEVRIHGYSLTLRLAEAEHIKVVPSGEADIEPQKPGAGASMGKVEHPGLGEGGKYHPKGSGEALPEDTLLTFALVGNQNCGKTTLFNQLTGSNQRVGNFPGVTVDRKDGVIKGHPNTLVTDLPGIYSMSPYSSEEIVSRNFVLQEKPKAIINIVDATNIERNMYLTLQLLEMEIPMVVALNMMDELISNGGMVDVNMMESMLGVPVIPISAAKNQGIEELIDHAIHIAKYQERPGRQDFCDENDNGGAVHRGIHAVTYLIGDHAKRCGYPELFAAGKVIEGDELVMEPLKLDQNERETIEHIVQQMETERGLDRNAAMAEMRFAFIQKVCDMTVKKPSESKERVKSERIDRLLTGKYTAIPTFIVIMGLIFYLTFNVIGLFLQNLLEAGVEWATETVDSIMVSANVNPFIHGIIIDGIFTGVGSVLSFLPIIVTLFFFLSILEDSGYTARIAFVMDRLLRKIGLSGRSIVPMLIGFGCTVPAVMATRTLPSERDRRMTILLTPFMSCSAKLPIYGYFVNAFFPKQGGFIMIGLYLLGIIIGILIALLYRNTLFKGEAVPFVMELPNYRMPSSRNVFQLLWEKAKDFLERAFSVILVATVIIWLLKSFDPSFQMVTDAKDSILAIIAGWFAPLMAPLGLGDWRICTALISGFMAKESVVASLLVLFENGVAGAISPLSAGALLVFSLLYAPCVAAIASIRREMGSKWAVGVVIWQCAIAWVAGLAVYLIGGLL
ncbi:MAG: ferrous iron transport protein B [Firmicutes bacterium]|nr:ferrous iron transport protein B [Bacillota bacterium]MBR6473607.1 ferrous iron transport protein B [Bacillota bacterium]